MSDDDLEMLASQEVTSASLHEVRTASVTAGHLAGLDDDRADRFALAVHEAAANVVEHGGGTGELKLVKDDQRALTADITDTGHGMRIPDPILRPEPGAVSGRGLWLTQTMADRMHVDSGTDGTAVHIEMDLGDPPADPS